MCFAIKDEVIGSVWSLSPCPRPPLSVDPPTARPTPLSIARVAGEVSHQKVASCFPVASHCWLGAAGLPWKLPSRERDIQWAGQGQFRLVLQTLFVAAHEDDPRNDEENGQHEENDADRPNQPVNIVTEAVSSRSLERDPDEGSGCIEEQEARPVHAVGADQKGGPGPQHRHKPPEEDHFPAVLQEQILA
jgi:hypothetical protein